MKTAMAVKTGGPWLTRLAVVFGALGLWLFIASPAGAARTEFFGIAQQQLDDQDLRGMRSAGVRTDRFELGWRFLEPSEGSFNWKRADHLIGSLASYGIRPAPFVWGSPKWAESSPSIPPLDTAAHQQAWQTFLAKAVARYGPDGTYWANGYRQEFGANATPRPIESWQIWNEPNLTKFFNPGGSNEQSVQKYGQLLKISRDPIKGEDPEAQIVLAGNPAYPPSGGLKAWDFLDALYGVPGIKDYFDVVALHPYASNLNDFRGNIQKVRGVITGHADGQTPLWLTEFGWGSAPHDRFGINQGAQGQARLLSDSFKVVLSNRSTWNVQRMYWFLWRDPPADSTFAHRCSFCGSAGLLRHDRTGKPSFAGFKGFTAEKKPPQASITAGPSEGGFTKNRTPRFSFASSEPGSTFECRLDGGTLKPCGSTYTLPRLPDGTHALALKATDAPGNESAVVSRSFTVDTRRPTVAPSGQSLVTHTQLGQGTVPVRLGWSGADDRTGAAGLTFDLEKHTSGGGTWGPWSSVLANTSLRTMVPSLTPGTQYQYRVRSRDGAGNASAFKAGSAFTPRVLQESDAAYTGPWRAESQGDASGGSVKTSSHVGATATFTFTGKSAGVVMPLRSTLGSVKVCVDPGTGSQSCTPIDLSPASGLGPRMIVFTRNALSTSGQHHITITVLSGRADLDALARVG